MGSSGGFRRSSASAAASVWLLTCRPGSSTTTAGPTGCSCRPGSMNVRAMAARSPAVTGRASVASRRSSSAVNDPPPYRHRSSSPQQPCRSANTTMAVSLTPSWLCTSRQSSDRSGCPSVSRISEVAVTPAFSMRSQRQYGVRYREQINAGSRGQERPGTSASGEVPTRDTGSVSGKLYPPNGTARRASATSSSRSALAGSGRRHTAAARSASSCEAAISSA